MNIKTPKIFFLIFYLTKGTFFKVFKGGGGEITPEKIQKIYSFYSPFYDLIFGKTLLPGLKSSIDRLGIKPGDHILEVGIGTGTTIPLYPDDCVVTGIDISKKMLDKANKKLQKTAKKNIELKQMDACNLDLNDNYFDGAIAAHLMSVVPDPELTLSEIKRVCKPGSKIIIINHFKSKKKVISKVEDFLSPLSKYIGFYTNIDIDPLLETVKLKKIMEEKVNLFKICRLIKCINEK